MGVKATRFFALVLGYADAHKVLSRTRTRALARARQTSHTAKGRQGEPA